MKVIIRDIAIKILKDATELTDLLEYDDAVETAVEVMLERAEFTSKAKPIPHGDLELMTLVPDNTVFIQNVANQVVKEVMFYRTLMDKMQGYENQFNQLVAKSPIANILAVGVDNVLEDKLPDGVKHTITPTETLREYVASVVDIEPIKEVFSENSSEFYKDLKTSGWADIHNKVEVLNELNEMEHDGDAKFSLIELNTVLENAYFIINSQYDSYKNREANSKGKIRAGKTIVIENEKFVPIFNSAYNKLGSFVLENEKAITPDMSVDYVMRNQSTLETKVSDIRQKEQYIASQKLVDDKVMLIRQIGLENDVPESKIAEIQRNFVKYNTPVEEILLSIFDVGNLRAFLSVSNQFKYFDRPDRLIETAYLVVKWLLAQVDFGE